MEREVMYRYETGHFIEPLFPDEDGEPIPPSEYTVLRHTPQGKWVGIGARGERFVLNNSKKRFAHETKEAALESFIYRKKKQLKILRAQIDRVEEALRAAQKRRA